MLQYREIYVAIEREPWLRVELQKLMEVLHGEQHNEHSRDRNAGGSRSDKLLIAAMLP